MVTDPRGLDITPDNGFENERGDVEIEVGGATRTKGFWSTHPDFTEYVFANYLGSYIDLGRLDPIENMEDLMGVFWANNAKNSDKSRRDALCQFRVIASKQTLAAILNSAMPGGAPLPAGYSLSEIASILYNNDIDAIKMLNTDLTAFNESGDDIALDPSLPPTGRANPNDPHTQLGAKNIANIKFADCSMSIGLGAANKGKGNNK